VTARRVLRGRREDEHLPAERTGIAEGERRPAQLAEVEGEHAPELLGGQRPIMLVCDQDDPETASPLLSATMGLEVGQS
jgi:hypothetical protein